MSHSLQDNLDNPSEWLRGEHERESGSLNGHGSKQMIVDLVYGLLRDWTCIAAGLPGPWTDSLEDPLTDLLEGCQHRPPYSSSAVVSERNAPTSLASTVSEDFFSMNDHIGATNTGNLHHSKRRSRRALVPLPDLIDDVSSRKRRRILRNRPIASYPGDPVVHGQLGDDITSLPSSSRKLKACASADRKIDIGYQQPKFKSQTVTTEHPKNLQRARKMIHPSRVPLTPKAGCVSALFISELIPSSFTLLQRFQVLDVLHYEAPYIPTCIVGATGQIPRVYFGDIYCNQQFLPQQMDDHPYEMPQSLGSPLVTKSKVTLPFDVLAQIARHLNRLDMQALLLTSKEYNAKLGPLYFQHVVLPFKSNIFSGMKNTSPIDSMDDLGEALRSTTLPTPSTPSAVTDHSGEHSKNQRPELNMFKTWGSSITKFGFSLEADEDELKYAPQKQVMNEYTTFYADGIPWPTRAYRLNSMLERLDTTADQKNLMELAFSHLTDVNELALAVDSGLGYLEGFDKSDRAKIVADKSKVFGRRFSPSKADEIRLWLEVGSNALAHFSLQDKKIYNSYIELLRRLSRPTGPLIGLVTYYMNRHPRGSLAHFSTMDIFGHVKTVMLRAGIITPNQHPTQYDTFRLWAEYSTLTLGDVRQGSHWNQTPQHPTRRTVPGAMLRQRTIGDYHSLAPSGLLLPENYRPGPLYFPNRWIHTGRFSQCAHPNPDLWDACSMHTVRELNRSYLTRLFCGTAGNPPPVIFDDWDILDEDNIYLSPDSYLKVLLKPRSLTTPQKQWLVETGWMQQTFITSYMNAIIKNKSSFATVRSFTLAKLSSGYLPRLHDREFWSALSQLENLTILVSPDWREIAFGHEGEFTSKPVEPSHACTMLTMLLYELSSITSIKALKTGYVGGGEHAVGLHARNQHILPAPITDEGRTKRNIVMPHIKSLTFVNCWFVPNTLMTFLKDMIRTGLHSIHFDSVSLLVAGGKTISFPVEWPAHFPPQLLADPSTNTLPPFYLGHNVPQPGTAETVRQSQITPTHVHPHPATQDGYDVPVSWRSQRLHPDTWTTLIDTYTSGPTLADKKAALAGRPPSSTAPLDRHHRLARLSFSSCGYAKLAYQRLGPVLDAPEGPPPDSFLRERRDNIEPFVMKSGDPFLGVIVPTLVHPELATLTGGFGMVVGPWMEDPGRMDNREDGRWDRGTGRFSGEVGGA